MNKQDIPTPTTDPKSSSGTIPMTQAECEAFIMLAGQSGKPVFEIHMVDKTVDQDPTMRALMEAVTLMIHQGIMGLPFQESEAARGKEPAPMTIVKPNGKPAA
jgi:hypothetical protein